MVFGLFKKPADTLALYSDYAMLKTFCPAGAYMFANAFGIAFGYAQVPGASKHQRRDYVEAYLQECIQTFSVDKGSRMLAVQSIIKIADSAAGGWDRFPTDHHIVAIAKDTDIYRELEPEDHEPPLRNFQREFIEYAGVTTFAEFVELKESELPEDLDDGERDWQYGKNIAVFDAIAEWETGDLKERLGAIAAWVKQ